MTGSFRWSILAAPLALIACSNTSEAPKSASADAPAEKPAKLNKDPYPSTYKPYPGVATAIVGTARPGRFEENADSLGKGLLSEAQFAAIRARWAEVADPSWEGQM